MGMGMGKNSGDGVGMGTEPMWRGWGWGPSLWGWGRDGERNHGDGWGWGRALVPVQLSTTNESLPFLLFGSDEPISSFVGVQQWLMTLQLVKNVKRTLLLTVQVRMIRFKLQTVSI